MAEQIKNKKAWKQKVQNALKKHNAKGTVLFVFAVAVFYAVLNLFGITCPIKYLTGVSCLGCGMTRAYLSLLRFDFAQAFYYHPLWLLVPVYFIFLFLFRNQKRRKCAVSIIIATIFFLAYFVRLFDPNCEIVVFQTQEGLLYGLFAFIMKFFRKEL